MSTTVTASPARGLLGSRPGTPTGACTPGLRSLGLDARDALLFVPSSAKPGVAMPLVVLLHGSGGKASDIVGLMRSQAEDRGFAILAPQSRNYTWDVVLGGFGPDVEFIDRALDKTFSQCAIDAQQIAVAGFSDGASYALSLGQTNGTFFSRIIAFSPGFTAARELNGRPQVFISHGVNDQVLPIDRCSRVIVPQLQSQGYNVHYEEFNGGHEVPTTEVNNAINWFLGPR